MLSNVPHSNFYFECNTERGCIDQLYIELGTSRLEQALEGDLILMYCDLLTKS